MRYKFSELNSKARKKAINNYQKGWLETHPDDGLTYLEAQDCCMDIEEEFFYNQDGTDFVECP